jgi:hypothetical protein
MSVRSTYDRLRHPVAKQELKAALELREAFGPGTHFWRLNTLADVRDDLLEFRREDPGAPLRGYVRILLHHEVRRHGTPAWPLMRRLVAFLRRHGGE